MCQFGGAISGSEPYLSGPYTLQECIDLVREKHPGANGFSRDEPCHSTELKCNCYAQIGLTGWGTSNYYHTCMFGDKGK